MSERAAALREDDPPTLFDGPVSASDPPTVIDRAGALPAIIPLPDHSQPEPAPPPPRQGPRRSGKMKGRHFGPRPVDDPRSAWLTTRTTPEFLAKVRADAEAAGLTLSDYVHVELGGKRSPRPRRAKTGPNEAALARILASLGRSGNNQNQILKRVNSYDFRGLPELLDMRRAIMAAVAAHHELVASIKAELGV